MAHAGDIGFSGFCQDLAGCASGRERNGVLTEGSIAVWFNEDAWWTDVGLLDTLIKHIIMHELLHVLLPMNHRLHPSSIMNSQNAPRVAVLSEMDEALIRLYSHPLVRPNMTMGQVKSLIVFNDDLLDAEPSPQPDEYRIIQHAFAALWEAGSARFKMRGGWTGWGCYESFGGSDDGAYYHVADFGTYYPGLIQFQDGDHHFYLIQPFDDAGTWEYWSQRGSGQWQRISATAFYETTAWDSEFSSLHTMLASILFFSNASAIDLSVNSDGTLTLDVSLDSAFIQQITWSNGETIDVRLVLDAETYHVREYSMEWDFEVRGDFCSGYEVEAWDGEYGVELEVPAAIRQESQNLP